MPRGPRILPDEGVIHLICRGNNHIQLCKDAHDFQALKNRLIEYTHFYPIEIYHYALMHTHLHLLAYVKDCSQLSCALKALQVCYFHYYKRKYGYEGHLWHGRYRSIPILQETHFLQSGRYIELNPIRAKLVQNPKEYSWTSYPFYAFGKRDPLITINPQYLEWGISNEERQQKYKKFIFADQFFDTPPRQVSKIRGNVP